MIEDGFFRSRLFIAVPREAIRDISHDPTLREAIS